MSFVGFDLDGHEIVLEGEGLVNDATALVLLRSAPPIVTRMRTWLDRPDAKELRADRAGIEALLQRRPLEEPGAPA